MTLDVLIRHLTAYRDTLGDLPVHVTELGRKKSDVKYIQYVDNGKEGFIRIVG